MTETPAVLDLTSVFTRDTVKLPSGKEYEIRNKQELGLVEDAQLRALIKRFTDFTATASESEEDAVKASQLLRDLATMLVVDVDSDVPDYACVAIFEFWTDRNRPAEPPANPRKPRARRPKTATPKKTTARRR